MSKDLQKAGTKTVAVEREVFDTRNVVKTLEGLMNRVTDKDCTPDTVNAACNCADKITEILRLHLDVERLKTRMQK